MTTCAWLMSPASAPSERSPMQRMPAAMAAVTPTGESSIATQHDGITSSARAALR